MENERLFLNLPSVILLGILSRLPAKTIIQCRYVCKAWFKLLSSPDFVNLHLFRSPPQLLINNLSFPQSFMSRSSPNASCFNLVEVKDEPDHHGLHYVVGTKMEIPYIKSGMTIVGSINGLVCLNEVEYPHDALYLWNPTTNERIMIDVPMPPEAIRDYSCVVTYGFGFSLLSCQYKIFRIFQELENLDSGTNSPSIRNSTCHVYTLGAGCWRSIRHASFLHSSKGRGLFLNGNLHWLINDQEHGSEFISCLDVENETFQLFPLPELCKRNWATLNLYGCCLSICNRTSEFEIVIWVMKEYGINNSWSKEVVIDNCPIHLFGNHHDEAQIVKVFKDGEILLLRGKDWLLSYHPERKTMESIDARDLIGAIKKKTCCYEELNPSIEVIDHVSSFVSLKDLVMGV